MTDEQPTRESAPPDSMRLGPYRLERRLGAGGMGEVYLAIDTRLHRRVAIKLLTGAAATDKASQQRFQTEARTASSLSHPHICAVFDVGEESGRPYLVMEFLEGETLRARLGRGALTVAEACDFARQIADALETAHRSGIIHRDIKPENVFLTARGVKVVDFGIAKVLSLDGDATTLRPAMMTREGTALGTVAYMSPEQARGEAIDPRSDLFSLGVTFYEMLAGERPFRGPSDAVVFDAILNRPASPVEQVRVGVPPAVAAVVSRLLQKRPDDRLQRATDVIQALTGGESPAVAARAVVPSRVAMRLLAAIAAVAVLSAGGWWWRASAPTLENIRSLAILPIAVAADEPLREPLQGVTNAVINELSRRPPLRVLPATATSRYENAADTPTDVGRALAVDAVVHATAERQGARIGLRVVATESRTGADVWTKSYAVDGNDLFGLQRDWVSALETALGVPPAPPAEAVPANPQAYDLYLRGRYHSNRFNAQSIDQSIALLEQATALDPGFAPAQGLLAFVYGVKVFNFSPTQTALIEKGHAAMEKALAVDPDSPDAHAARGMLLWQPSQGFPSKAALDEYRRAIAARPNFDEAWHQRGLILFHVGHLDAGMRAIERAIALNPAHAQARFRPAPIFNYQARYADAFATLQRVPRDVYSTQWSYHMAIALIGLNRLDQAAQAIDESLRAGPADQGGVMHAARALLRAKRGDRKGAQADIAEAKRIGEGFGHFHHTAYSIGTVHAVLGELTLAQEWIERAANDGFPCYLLFEADPDLAQLREQPSFQAFLKRIRAEWERIDGEE